MGVWYSIMGTNAFADTYDKEVLIEQANPYPFIFNGVTYNPQNPSDIKIIIFGESTTHKPNLYFPKKMTIVADGAETTLSYRGYSAFAYGCSRLWYSNSEVSYLEGGVSGGYVGKLSPVTVDGKWVFGTSLLSAYDAKMSGGSVTVDVRINGVEYKTICFMGSKSAYIGGMAEGGSSFKEGWAIGAFATPTELQTVPTDFVLFNTDYGNTTTLQEQYRNMEWDFGDGQEVPQEFYTWLTANATQQASEEEDGGATVAYNGSDLLSLEAGQTGTLNCAGTKMAGDVVVSFEGVGSVAYNGSVIASLSAGQSATLYCAGKKMAGNIVITCDGDSSN